MLRSFRTLVYFIVIIFSIASCKEKSQEEESDYLFESIDQAYSNVEFVNRLDYKEEFNIGCLDGYMLLNNTKCGTYQPLNAFMKI